MPVYFDDDKQRWRFTFNRIVAGRRQRATKLLPKGWSRARAEEYDRREGSRLYAQAAGIEQQSLTLAGAVTLYLDHRLPELRDRANIARELAHLVDHIEGKALSQAGDVARAYRKDATKKKLRSEGKPLSPATVRNRLAYLKAAVRYAYRRHNYGDRNYAEHIELPTVHNERQVYIKVDVVREVLQAIEHVEDRAVFTLSFWCGLRWRASVLPRQKADVLRNGRDVWLVAGITKNGTPRMKFVKPEARWALEHLPFDTERHWRTRYASYEAAIAGLELGDVVAHDLRHALASDILSRGGTLGDVGGALDHDSVISSRRYAHLYPERLKSVMQAVGKKKGEKRAGSRQKNAHRGAGEAARKAA